MLDQETLQAAADMLFDKADNAPDPDFEFHWHQAGVAVLLMMDDPADMTEMEWAAG